MEALIMAKSKAKKEREKLAREGRINPEIRRSPFADTEMFRFMAAKKTGTKKDLLYKQKYKKVDF